MIDELTHIGKLLHFIQIKEYTDLSSAKAREGFETNYKQLIDEYTLNCTRRGHDPNDARVQQYVKKEVDKITHSLLYTKKRDNIPEDNS
jgi:hypothetical protein